MSALIDFASVTLQSLDVLPLAGELLSSAEAVRDGRTARTLAKSGGLTVVLTAVRSGGSIGEHSAPGPLIILPLIGTAVFSGEVGSKEPHALSVGHVLFMRKGQKHTVSAKEDCAFLIVIGDQS